MARTKKQSLGGKDRIAIIDGVRTPFVKAWSEFKHLNEADLGRHAVNELINRVDIDPNEIDECIFGCVSAPMNGPNVAREIVLRGQLPNHIPAYTVQMYCASSAMAAVNGIGDILSGAADVVVVGGVEAMSAAQARISLPLTQALNEAGKAKSLPDRVKAFTEVHLGDLKPDAPSIAEPTTGLSMGQSAEEMAKEYGITRAEQDWYAELTHHRAGAAAAGGKFDEIVPIMVGEHYETVVSTDTMVRPNTSVEKMAKLRPVFDRKHGTITAANASPLTDGASAVLMMRESRAKALGLQPKAFVKSHAIVGLDLFKYAMLLGPTFATPIALKRAGLTLKDIDLVEMHEAFAAQVLANLKIWGSAELAKSIGLDKKIGDVDYDGFNLNGGSIPLGHPFGATGTRLMMQLSNLLNEHDKNLGVLTACAAGGLGVSMVLERN